MIDSPVPCCNCTHRKKEKEKEKNVISNDFVCHAFNTINALNVLSLHLGRPSSKNIPACTSAFFSLSPSAYSPQRTPYTLVDHFTRDREREAPRYFLFIKYTSTHKRARCPLASGESTDTCSQLRRACLRTCERLTNSE